MSRTVTIRGVELTVPEVEQPVRGRTVGKHTGLPISRFIRELFITNEKRFEGILSVYCRLSDDVPPRQKADPVPFTEVDKELHPSVKDFVRGLTSKDDAGKLLPFNDSEIAHIILDEFAHSSSTVDSFITGNSRISEFRSRYRRGDLCRGEDVVYAPFAYNLGFPIAPLGGSHRPMTDEEIVLNITQNSLDPRNRFMPQSVKL